MFNYKVHPDHVHLIKDSPQKTEIILSFEELELIVSQFLRYYREGETDTSGSLPLLSLEDDWKIKSPSHIDEKYTGLWASRKQLYQIVNDNNLFNITLYNPPEFTPENIFKVQDEYKKVVNKSWISDVINFGRDQVAFIQSLSDKLTKEEINSFLTASSGCPISKVCDSLQKTEIEVLGSKPDFGDEDWHKACPLYEICYSPTDVMAIVNYIRSDFSKCRENELSVKQITLNLITDFKNGNQLTDAILADQIEAEWCK